MKPIGSVCSHRRAGCHCRQSNMKTLRSVVRRSPQSSATEVHTLTATVSSQETRTPRVPDRVTSAVIGNTGSALAGQSVEEKRLLIRKQLVILLHAIVCRRRDLINANRGDAPPQPCNVPFCGLMKSVLLHLNSCKTGRTCTHSHCASSRQILTHWKYCVKTECPVCVSLRQVVPTSLLQIFPNALCRSEILQRIARMQLEVHNANASAGGDQAVPELMESEE